MLKGRRRFLSQQIIDSKKAQIVKLMAELTVDKWNKTLEECGNQPGSHRLTSDQVRFYLPYSYLPAQLEEDVRLAAKQMLEDDLEKYENKLNSME